MRTSVVTIEVFHSAELRLGLFANRGVFEICNLESIV